MGPMPAQASRPISISDHAADNLEFIRATMERSHRFSAVPGWGGVAMGAIGCAAGLLAFYQPDAWFRCWLIAALIAAPIGLTTMRRKASGSGQLLWSAAGRRFALGFSPPMLSAILLTAVMARAHQLDFVPALWLLLYGSAVIAGGMFSIPVVPVMGGCFLALGAAAAAWPTAGNLFLAAGFGAVQIIFGLIIARRFGG